MSQKQMKATDDHTVLTCPHLRTTLPEDLRSSTSDVKSHSPGPSWILRGSARRAWLSFLPLEAPEFAESPPSSLCRHQAGDPGPQTLTRGRCSGRAAGPGHPPARRAAGWARCACQVRSGSAGGELGCEERSRAAACFVERAGHGQMLCSGNCRI